MKYFVHKEFDSPDEPGSGKAMRSCTLRMLDEARGFASIPFIITSGFRTKEHNNKVGGVDSSAHTKGYAVDIRINTSSQRYDIIMACKKAGFTRFGIATYFLHVDNDPSKPKYVMWPY